LVLDNENKNLTLVITEAKEDTVGEKGYVYCIEDKTGFKEDPRSNWQFSKGIERDGGAPFVRKIEVEKKFCLFASRSLPEGSWQIHGPVVGFHRTSRTYCNTVFIRRQRIPILATLYAFQQIPLKKHGTYGFQGFMAIY
jgi:hypothetical protein